MLGTKTQKESLINPLLVCHTVHTLHDALRCGAPKGTVLGMLSMHHIAHLEIYGSYTSCCHDSISTLSVGVVVRVCSSAPKCFVCVRDLCKCSCLDIQTCSNCSDECLPREAPSSNKKCLSLRDVTMYLVVISNCATGSWGSPAKGFHS